MQKAVQTFMWLSVALFFVSMAAVASVSSYMLLKNDGDLLATLVAKVIHKTRTAPTTKKSNSPALLEKVLNRLLANDAKLLTSILQQAFRRPLDKDGHTPVSRALGGAFDKLLAEDARLLIQLIKGLQRKDRINPAKYLIDRLLARNGRLLKKVVVPILASQSKGKKSKGMLGQNKKAIASILSQVLKEVGVTATIRDVRGKVKGIKTNMDLRYEVRRMLAGIPRMVVKFIALNQKRKMRKNKDWRAIKSKFPQIKASILQDQCLRFTRLRRGKNNQLIVRARVKIVGRSADNQRCIKRSCSAYVQHIDQAVLKYTQKLGMHEGNIKIKFNLRMRRCNSNR